MRYDDPWLIAANAAIMADRGKRAARGEQVPLVRTWEWPELVAKDPRQVRAGRAGGQARRQRKEPA